MFSLNINILCTWNKSFVRVKFRRKKKCCMYSIYRLTRRAIELFGMNNLFCILNVTIQCINTKVKHGSNVRNEGKASSSS